MVGTQLIPKLLNFFLITRSGCKLLKMIMLRLQAVFAFEFCGCCLPLTLLWRAKHLELFSSLPGGGRLSWPNRASWVLWFTPSTGPAAGLKLAECYPTPLLSPGFALSQGLGDPGSWRRESQCTRKKVLNHKAVGRHHGVGTSCHRAPGFWRWPRPRRCHSFS